MDDVARLAPQERADLFNEASAQRGLVPAILEKDFWVCWILKRVFALPGDNPALIFKGGTSLSKVYGVIRRFSEDIDLSFDRHTLGYTGAADPDTAPSRRKREDLLERLDADVTEHIAKVLLPRLEEGIARELPGDRTWRVEIDPREPKTVLFHYPPSLTGSAYANMAYLSPGVRLELGARGDVWPTGQHEIRAYAAEQFPTMFKAPIIEVPVLAAERTFWEKATLLHEEYHRPADKSAGERLSRHLYDLALLADTPYGERAVRDLELLDKVTEHKTRFFPRAWASYETAKAGSLRLVPPDSRFGALNADYDKMKLMIFDEPPPFATVIARLRKLEEQINGG